MEPVFVQINGDLFNVIKIQAITYSDEKNRLGEDSGVYLLNIFMENNIGTTRKMYKCKKERDEDYKKTLNKLNRFGISYIAGKNTKSEPSGATV